MRAASRLLILSMLILSAGSVFGQTVTGELTGDGIARFYPSDLNLASLPPSMALLAEQNKTGELPSSWIEKPTYTRNGTRKIITFPITDGTSLYGTGENAGPLLRNGRTVTLWPTDAFGYWESNPSLYQAIPWVLAVRPDGSSYGVIANTTYKLDINLSNGIQFQTDGPDFYCLVIQGASPQEVIKKCAVLTGKIELPPLWALGYQQSRYSYTPDSKVKAIADSARANAIPCDVIWLDIDYMDNYKVFTFNPTTFPDPAGLNNYLHSKNFKAVWMVNPGIAAVSGYSVYDQGTAQDIWVKNADGTSNYVDKVWPPQAVFPDFTMATAQTFFKGFFKDFMAKGIDGVWNDMNEPAIFNSSKTMPEGNVHRGGATASSVGTLPRGTHAQYHNVYGMLMAKTSLEGIMAANPDKRPFVLSRSNYLGGQRYAATWTGDNNAMWELLRWANSMILNLGLSMQPFSGADIGGFTSNSGIDLPTLFARWMGVGALYPFSRAHTNKDAPPKEPWAFNAATTASCRTAIQRRYRLLPYFYTLFRESSENGMPVMRPIFFADPKDANLRDEYQSFLLGDNLLVIPNLYLSNPVTAKEPSGVWRTIYLIDKTKETDINQPVLKIHEGSIIPTGRVVQSTAEKMLDTLTLYVCLNTQSKASGTLYEDAGEGYGYKTGDYLFTRYGAKPYKKDSIIVTIDSVSGNTARPDRTAIVKVVTQDSTYTSSGNEKTGIVAYAPGITAATSKNGVMHTTTSMAISKNMIRIANLNGDAGVLRIYSIDGKAVYSHVINKSDKSFALPLSAVRCGEGIYCIQLTGTNDTHTLTSFIAHK